MHSIVMHAGLEKMSKPQMLLGMGFLGSFGASAKAWQETDTRTYPDFAADVRYAQLAERGKFHFLFLGDFPGLVPQHDSEVPMMTLEPIVSGTNILAQTRHIGVVATVHTQWNYPFTVARQFKAMDLMSGGRMAWNAVTGSSAQVADCFGVTLMQGESRHEKHQEFVQIVQNLWACWGENALEANRDTGVFADYSQVKPVFLQGKYLKVSGTLPLPPSSQGQPVVFHAGGSPNSIEFAGRYANVMIGEVWTIEQGRATRDALRQAAMDNGRDPDEVKFIAGIMPTIADSKREALDRHASLMSLMGEKTMHQHVRNISMVLGVPLSLADLDKPIDPMILDNVRIAPYSDPRTELVLKVAREGWSLRDVINHSVIDYHPATLGDATVTADHMTEWFEAGACDGFWVLPDVYEHDLKRFVDEVVPILQERGIFHAEYEGNTLRENLGIPYQYGVDNRIFSASGK